MVDAVDDRVAARWGGIPARLFVIGTDGKVLYAGRQGPWGFRPTQDFVHGDNRVPFTDLFYTKSQSTGRLFSTQPILPIARSYIPCLIPATNA